MNFRPPFTESWLHVNTALVGSDRIYLTYFRHIENGFTTTNMCIVLLSVREFPDLAIMYNLSDYRRFVVSFVPLLKIQAVVSGLLPIRHF